MTFCGFICYNFKIVSVRGSYSLKNIPGGEIRLLKAAYVVHSTLTIGLKNKTQLLIKCSAKSSQFSLKNNFLKCIGVLKKSFLRFMVKNYGKHFPI